MKEASENCAAVFLDRDGTLIEETHYLNDPNNLRILPGACEAVRRINRAGLLTIVVTNQSAVARGLLNESQLSEIHRCLAHLFESEGARIDAFYYCPHHPEIDSAEYGRSCDCRKPRPGLLVRAAEELHLDLKSSVMIGDRLLDVEAGHRAGCSAVLVRTGYGAAEEDHLSTVGRLANPLPAPILVCDDILSAVAKILEKTRESKS